eukprot:433537_1
MLDKKKDKLRKELYDLCNSYGSRKVFKQVSKHSKVRDEEFIKFVVDMQSGNQTFEAHPRRSKCVLLMEIISKRNGKVNYDRYFTYHILFVSIREYYARQKLLDIVPGYLRRSGLVDLDCMNLIMAFYDKRDIMNKVSSDKVIQTINESDADIDRMIAVAQFDNSYTVTNKKTIEKYFNEGPIEIKSRGVVVDFKFKRFKKSFYTVINPNVRFAYEQEYSLLFMMVRFQSVHLPHTLFVSSDDLSTIKK